MYDKEDIKRAISALDHKLKSDYHVKKLSLFGSYARGEATKSSDVDILVDFEITPDLLTFIELEEFLSDKLQRSVDLVPARKLKQSLKKEILGEAISL
jgi:predicted nucleotidyltransferase